MSDSTTPTEAKETPEADRVRAIYAAGKQPNFNMLCFAATESWAGTHGDGVEVDGHNIEWSRDVADGILHAMRALSKLGALNMDN